MRAKEQLMETDWYKALGVTQETAQADDEPAEETETAEPEAIEPQDAAADETEEGGQETAKQSRQENSRYAAARRKAEQERDEAIARVKEEAAREADQLIADMGIKNPYTGEKITTRAEYNAYKQTHEQRRQQQIQQKLDMDDDEFNQMVEDLPVVKEARAKAQEAERLTKQQREQEARAQVEREMANITAMNPNIKTAEDLSRDDQYKKILDYVKMGHPLDEAYRFAHIDDLAQRSGRQQAINRAGKAHMTSTQARGEGAAAVPAEVNDWYRKLNPKSSDEDIARHYNRIHGGR